MRGDGQALALALLPLLELDVPFNPNDLDGLAQEGLKKSLGHCEPTDIDRLSQHIRSLVQQHQANRDPRHQLLDDFRAVVTKHKNLIERDRVLEVLQIIIKELQIDRL